jgi:hypothetical protein
MLTVWSKTEVLEKIAAAVMETIIVTAEKEQNNFVCYSPM